MIFSYVFVWMSVSVCTLQTKSCPPMTTGISWCSFNDIWWYLNIVSQTITHCVIFYLLYSTFSNLTMLNSFNVWYLNSKVLWGYFDSSHMQEPAQLPFKFDIKELLKYRQSNCYFLFLSTNCNFPSVATILTRYDMMLLLSVELLSRKIVKNR